MNHNPEFSLPNVQEQTGEALSASPYSPPAIFDEVYKDRFISEFCRRKKVDKYFSVHPEYKKDITAWELAQLTNLILGGSNPESAFGRLEPSCFRHLSSDFLLTEKESPQQLNQAQCEKGKDGSSRPKCFLSLLLSYLVGLLKLQSRQG